MTKPPGDILPPWSLAIAAIFSIQLSSALAVSLIDSIGAGGAAWLRTTAGALLLLLIARPPLRSIHRQHVPALVGLGVTTGLMSLAFLAALEHIPLGTAVAVEFLGPLTVVAVRSHSRRALAWPGLALLGVVLLTEPWQGAINLVGLGFAALAGACWGCYIVLTQHVGDRFTGITGLSITLPIAAISTAIVGVPQATGHLTPMILLAGLGLGLLHPLLTFALEMTALKRMTTAAFGTLMAIEPAIALLIGLVVLHQQPTLTQLVGIALVIVAGAAAQQRSRRPELLPT
ncbi:putative threonine/homoserine efflux protein [Microlunatus phosphovorus NM-1]|uniref:Putative threonine/homoserine efflux protein n=1 Tax=Microlunatus phosphovorus (strain ATCC 700054 / DSM 10555 / JCM 9379 / NBRC 101784 / NCIMB 13414 / VKM Ac-1990 / NM-1) TaxID=1032480 RepID=F5XLR6_MICPN|nr:putative threonine/homoserine efflux protein [Microlunatus phosphovorus NM-1]